MYNCGRGYVVMMMALETGIVWWADIRLMEEPVFAKEGYEMSY
jgi:hypothetical protein